MDIKDYIAKLKELNACHEAVEYSEVFETSQAAWDACKRGDWMLWLIGKNAGLPWSEKRKKLTTASCQCVRLAWDKLPQASKDCIELFERWAGGEYIPCNDLMASRRAADAAAYAAYADAAYAAAAAYAADAAYAAADAAAYAAAYAVRSKTLAKCAHIVREYYPDIDKVLK